MAGAKKRARKMYTKKREKRQKIKDDFRIFDLGAFEARSGHFFEKVNFYF
jgi:hypothetical protein